jgi:probable selenium-dependent hydroxylase accessory protein YqeC
MWLFRKTDLLEITDQARFVSFVGAGGKSTLIEHIANEELRRGKRVAITTTTKIWVNEPYVLFDELRRREGDYPEFLRVGKSVEEGKLTALESREIWELSQQYDLILIEADGAKGKPLKYPAVYEPVIPPFSDSVLVVAGLDALCMRVDEAVFRNELFTQATGVPGDTELSEELFIAFFDPAIMLKDVELEKCVIVLNKYDACQRRGPVTDIAKLVSRVADNAPVLISSAKFGIFYGLKSV